MTSKPVRFAYWAVFIALTWAAAYFGIFNSAAAPLCGLNARHAASLFKFLSWYNFAISCATHIMHHDKAWQRDNPAHIRAGRAVPAVLNHGLDVLLILALAYWGWPGYAALWLIAVSFEAASYTQLDKLKKELPEQNG